MPPQFFGMIPYVLTIVVLVVVVLLFGSSQLPKLARSLGQAQKEFKQGIDEGSKTDTDSTSTDTKS